MRYLLFGSDIYYASGGGHDYIATSDNLDELIKVGKEEYGNSIEWWHVFDTLEGEIVSGSIIQGYGAFELPHDIEKRY